MQTKRMAVLRLRLLTAITLAGTARAFSTAPSLSPCAETPAIAKSGLRSVVDDIPSSRDKEAAAFATNGDASRAPSPSASAAAAALSSTARVGINSRGAKMNEIDFTLAPADVSLSRCYDGAGGGDSAQGVSPVATASSLARALNAASNRAVRRILLSRSWPSAAALNRSMRKVLQQQEQEAAATLRAEGGNKKQCPVPRPILNLLTGRPSPGAVDDGAPDLDADDLSPAQREER